MAKQVIEQVLSDLSGEEGAETIHFATDGTAYEIDLTEQEVKEFGAMLEPFVTHARQLKGGTAGRKVRGLTTKLVAAASKPATSTASGEMAQIRAWAANHGMTLATRGRISKEIVDQYRAEQGQSAPVAVMTAAPAVAQKRGPKGKMPDLSEVAEVWHQVGNRKGLADAFSISYATAGTWMKKLEAAGLR